MEAKAITKYVRVSVRKAKPLLKSIRGLEVEESLKVLAFSAKRVAKAIEKTLKSAVANAKSKESKPKEDKLYVKEAYANEGPTLRRFITRAHGRATRIRKRTSHITIKVFAEDKKVPEKALSAKAKNSSGKLQAKRSRSKVKKKK